MARKLYLEKPANVTQRMSDLSESRFGPMLSAVIRAFEEGNNMAQSVYRAFPDLTADEILTLINLSYDRQAGDYIKLARLDMNRTRAWGDQLADCIRPLLPAEGGSVLEVGVGEATSLAQVLHNLGTRVREAYGLDVSHSRILHAKLWLRENHLDSNLFVADISSIPLASNSVDVVYSSHSLEPNRGREKALMEECLRVARVGVVLIEPIYELADEAEKAHMDAHNYARGLWDIAQTLPAEIVAYRRLELYDAPNPKGVLALQKYQPESLPAKIQGPQWECPISGNSMTDSGSFFSVESIGIAYPVLSSIPLLARRNSVVASALVAGMGEAS